MLSKWAMIFRRSTGLLVPCSEDAKKSCNISTWIRPVFLSEQILNSILFNCLWVPEKPWDRTIGPMLQSGTTQLNLKWASDSPESDINAIFFGSASQQWFFYSVVYEFPTLGVVRPLEIHMFIKMMDGTSYSIYHT